MRFSSTISSFWNKDWRWMVWSFAITIRLLNQICKWVRWFIMGFINPLDLSTIFSAATAFFQLMTTHMGFRFTQPNFVKRRQMINKRVIWDEFLIIEIGVVIRVKKVVANIINLGIIVRSKHSFKQLIKDQMIQWWHIISREMPNIFH